MTLEYDPSVLKIERDRKDDYCVAMDGTLWRIDGTKEREFGDVDGEQVDLTPEAIKIIQNSLKKFGTFGVGVLKDLYPELAYSDKHGYYFIYVAGITDEEYNKLTYVEEMYTSCHEKLREHLGIDGIDFG